MRRSTQASSSRVLIIATILIVICGGMLCLPGTTHPPITASIAPVSDDVNVGETVPGPPSQLEPAQLPHHNHTAPQVEVPRFADHVDGSQRRRVERVAMLQPVQTFSDQPAVSVYDGDAGAFEDSFGEEFEDIPFEDSSDANEIFESKPLDAAPEPPSDGDFDFDDTAFGDFEPTISDIPSVQHDVTDTEIIDDFIEPLPGGEFGDNESRSAATVFDEATFKREMNQMHSDLAQSTEQKIRDAQLEHQQQIQRLQTEIDKLRAEKTQVVRREGGPATTSKTKVESDSVGPIVQPATPESSAASNSQRETNRNKRQDVAVELSETSQPTMLPPVTRIPAVKPKAATQPKPVPKTVEIPKARRRVPIEYPPIDMTPPTRKLPRETVPMQSYSPPSYLFITPANGVAMEQPALQPTRSTTSPQCTRSSPRRSLLSRLRSSRPEPCKHCGKVH